jgi:hypothetical protein
MSSPPSAASEDSTSDSIKPDGTTPSSANGTNTDAPSSPNGSPESPSSTTYAAFMPFRTLQKDGTVSEGFARREVIDALHGPTGNKEPLIVAMAFAWTEDDASPGIATRGYSPPVNGDEGNIAVLISSAAGSPARTSASPDAAQGSPGNGPRCSSSSPASLSLFDPAGFSSRTYPDCSPRTAVGTSESCLERWPTSGTAWHGGFSTAATSECPSADGECSSSPVTLGDVLEPNAPARYSLSARAATGILRRAEKRGRELPGALETALRSLAS